MVIEIGQTGHNEAYYNLMRKVIEPLEKSIIDRFEAEEIGYAVAEAEGTLEYLTEYDREKGEKIIKEIVNRYLLLLGVR